jgi:hypothetical protein
LALALLASLAALALALRDILALLLELIWDDEEMALEVITDCLELTALELCLELTALELITVLALCWAFTALELMELALCLELLLLLMLLLAVELVDTLAPDAVAVFDDDKLSDLDEELLLATTLDSVELLTTSEASLLVVSTVLAVAATWLVADAMVSLAVAAAVTLAEELDDLTPAASFVTDLDAVVLALAEWAAWPLTDDLAFDTCAPDLAVVDDWDDVDFFNRPLAVVLSSSARLEVVLRLPDLASTFCRQCWRQFVK